ncbi:unnamed protein product [Darwinula stevensoni]|uniref:Hexosyltransferase n=1 Tax=Darwinula stevensoni TaxID=69355 RepID=A0A7R9AFS1_9CRUS|nr:unnamed protein product [Darwinula stevensoni]CAG0902936.1 unnamed protein product [Darwinula stevensoni]
MRVRGFPLLFPSFSCLGEVDTTLADEISKKVRVLCWVMTQPRNHEARARHIKATWGRRCNVLLFMSSKISSSYFYFGGAGCFISNICRRPLSFPWAKGGNISGGRPARPSATSTSITSRALIGSSKAYDDTYVVVENLRFMLLSYEPKEPIYLGCSLPASSPV